MWLQILFATTDFLHQAFINKRQLLVFHLQKNIDFSASQLIAQLPVEAADARMSG